MDGIVRSMSKTGVCMTLTFLRPQGLLLLRAPWHVMISGYERIAGADRARTEISAGTGTQCKVLCLLQSGCLVAVACMCRGF